MDFSKPFSQFLFSTSRIVCRRPDASQVAGTGFVFHRSLEDGQHAPLLVTNKHVVQDMTSCQFFFTIGDQGIPRIGRTVALLMTDANEHWHYHPNPEIDLAVTPIAGFIEDAEAQGHSIYYQAIADSHILRDGELEKLDSSEEVCFVGYPNGLMDQANLTPVIRRGYTASHSAIDFGGKPHFLIDALVLPGSSGSPVQLVRSGAPAGLLGVVNAFLVMDKDGTVEMEDDFGTNETTGRRSLGLGNVIKAQELLVVADDFLKKHGLNPTLFQP